MAIIRFYTGPDGRCHFEDIEPRFEPRGDRSERSELIPGSGIGQSPALPGRQR